jgi:hypothetical protein
MQRRLGACMREGLSAWLWQMLIPYHQEQTGKRIQKNLNGRFYGFLQKLG